VSSRIEGRVQSNTNCNTNCNNNEMIIKRGRHFDISVLNF